LFRMSGRDCTFDPDAASTPVRVTCGAYGIPHLRLRAHSYITCAGWRRDASVTLQIQVCMSACCLLGPAMLTVPSPIYMIYQVVPVGSQERHVAVCWNN
jgi:hypothetical protein